VKFSSIFIAKAQMLARRAIVANVEIFAHHVNVAAITQFANLELFAHRAKVAPFENFANLEIFYNCQILGNLASSSNEISHNRQNFGNLGMSSTEILSNLSSPLLVSRSSAARQRTKPARTS
jgi:hypothetical protein